MQCIEGKNLFLSQRMALRPTKKLIEKKRETSRKSVWTKNIEAAASWKARMFCERYTQEVGLAP